MLNMNKYISQIGDTMCFRQSNDADIDSPIPISSVLEAVMEKNGVSTLPKWQYVGLTDGTFAKFPSHTDKRGCGSYDPRIRFRFV